MKNTIITLLIFLLISISSFAQQGINYKALIKDDNGNTLINTNIIDVQFTIYEGADLIEEVYYESRPNVLTDANGILIINIGEGVTNYDFSDISWGNDEHWLNVQIDIGDGLVDMGTTQFMAVPYAKHAETAANVSGLEKIIQNSATGFVFIGRNSNAYGQIGNNAVDLSYSNFIFNPSNTNGATGNNSVTMGYITEAFGDYTTAMGLYTNAESYGSLAIGRYNIGGFTDNAGSFNDGNTNWIVEDPLFEIGNGVSKTNRNNALTVLKNGNAKFDGEIQHTSTGTANMIPVAYGTISSTGTILSGTGNFTVNTANSPTFHINVTGSSLDHTNSSASVTPLAGAFRTSSITHSNGALRVYIFNSSGTQVTNTFQFVIYKL